MAKLKYGDQGFLEDDPYPGSFDVTLNRKLTTALYEDDETDGSITFVGHKLKVGGEKDLITSGTVDKLLFTDADGVNNITITGHFKGAALGKAFNFGVEGLSIPLLKGNDKLIGGTGDDRLNGYLGNDRINGGGGADELQGFKGTDSMTGGEGDDLFDFAKGFGEDSIKDFTDGEDLLSVTGPGISSYEDLESHIKSMHGDTWISLSKKDVLILDGVDRSTIDATDFQFDMN